MVSATNIPTGPHPAASPCTVSTGPHPAARPCTISTGPHPALIPEHPSVLISKETAKNKACQTIDVRHQGRMQDFGEGGGSDMNN